MLHRRGSKKPSQSGVMFWLTLPCAPSTHSSGFSIRGVHIFSIRVVEAAARDDLHLLSDLSGRTRSSPRCDPAALSPQSGICGRTGVACTHLLKGPCELLLSRQLCSQTLHLCPPVVKTDSSNIQEEIPELFVCKHFTLPAATSPMSGKHSTKNMAGGGVRATSWSFGD